MSDRPPVNGAAKERPPLRLKRLGSNSAARLLLARALLAQGQTARAAREADAVLRGNPEFAVAHLVRGLVHAADDRPADAVRSLEFAVRLDEGLQEAWFCLAHERREVRSYERRRRQVAVSRTRRRLHR